MVVYGMLKVEDDWLEEERVMRVHAVCRWG